MAGIGSPVNESTVNAAVGRAADMFLSALQLFHAIDVQLTSHAAELTVGNYPNTDLTVLENFRAQAALQYNTATANSGALIFHIKKAVALNPSQTL